MNQQYLNKQMYGVPQPSNNEYTDLNQSLGEEMRSKYPYSVQSAQTPMSYHNAPPINTMNAPPTNMMNAPPTNMMNAPPTNMNAPPIHMNAPPIRMNAPPSNMMNAPPIHMNAPPTNMMNAPPTYMMNAPPSTNPFPKTYSTPVVMSDNFQNIHIQNSFAVHNNQHPLSKNPSSDNNLRVFSNSNDIYDDGIIPKSSSNDSNMNTVFLNPVKQSGSYDIHDSNNAQSFFGSPTDQGAKSFFGSADKEEVFPAKVVKPRSLVTKQKADEQKVEIVNTAPPLFPTIKDSEIVPEITTNVNQPDITIHQYQHQHQHQHQQYQDQHHHFQQQQEFKDHPPHHDDAYHNNQQQQQFQDPHKQLNQLSHQQQNLDEMIQTFPQPPVENSHVPVSEPAETYPTPSRTLNESFTSPNRQNISDVSFSNPQTPINTSTMSPITPGSQTRFIENKFLNLNSLIESRRAELEALKKRNQASYSVVTGSSTQKSIIADDHHTKQLESDVKMWSSKYKDEKNKSEELETKIVDLTKQVYEFNQHILSMQSKESSNNLYMEEEIKMWSAKYEEEKKRSKTLELQLKTMSDQFDEHDKNFQTLRATGTDSIQGELAAELEQQVEELTNERDDLLDEADSLRSQLNSRIARIRELESNEFITKLQHEIDQLKQSLNAANSKLQSVPENLEDLMKENIELRGRLEMSEESRKKLEMLEGLRPQNNSQATMADADTNTDVNANINNDAISNTNTNEVANNWEQEKEELMKQWTMQANEWTAMREAMQTDVNKYYEHCLFMDAEASKFKVIAEEKEGERNAYKEELDHLKEQSLASASVPNINQDVFNTKIKEMEMNMAQKWVGLLVRRKKSFLLRRSFDIMRQKVAEKSTVGLVQPSKESAPPITGNDPSRGMGPPISNMYPSNNNLPPAQELRFRGKSNLTAEEDKQLQSDFDLIKQLQGSDKVVVTEKQDNIYNLMSSIFYKIIIWLLLIIIAFLYIKSCRIQSSSRPVRLTS